MEPVSQEYFNNTMNRVFKKIDDNQAKTDEAGKEMIKEVVALKTKFKMTVIPVIPERPCEFLIKHEADHEKFTDSWKKPTIIGIVVTIFLFIQQPIKIYIANLFKGN